jgi:hypothetical protein
VDVDRGGVRRRAGLVLRGLEALPLRLRAAAG